MTHKGADFQQEIFDQMLKRQTEIAEYLKRKQGEKRK